MWQIRKPQQQPQPESAPDEEKVRDELCLN